MTSLENAEMYIKTIDALLRKITSPTQSFWRSLMILQKPVDKNIMTVI